jgi:hypothetical protein
MGKPGIILMNVDIPPFEIHEISGTALWHELLATMSVFFFQIEVLNLIL